MKKVHFPFAVVAMGLVFVSGIWSVSACGLVGVSCTDQVVFGITVNPVDEETGAVIRDEVTVVASDGAFADTTVLPSVDDETAHRGGALLAPERPGIYTVEVTAAGYEPFRREGIHVRDDGCHVSNVEITAKLARR